MGGLHLNHVREAPAMDADLTFSAPILQYHLPFYLGYLAQWPEYCVCATAPEGTIQGYSAWEGGGRPL